MARQESKAKALEGGSPVPGDPKAYTHKAEVGLGLPKERAEAMEVACGIPKTGRTPQALTVLSGKERSQSPWSYE